MKKITIILPQKDVMAHIEGACDSTPFETLTAGHFMPELSSITALESIEIRLKQKKSVGRRVRRKEIENEFIGHLNILPARDNSVIMFVPQQQQDETIFDDFISLVTKHFKDLDLLVENRAEPWRKSPMDKQERDKDIWELRNSGVTWEKIASSVNCGVTTAKERYLAMQRILDDD